MLTLHGTWLTGAEADRGAFAIWGEIHKRRPRRSRAGSAYTPSPGQPANHPFSAPAARLQDALADRCPQVDGAELKPRNLVANLPSADGLPLSSDEASPEAGRPEAAPALAAWRVPALMLPVAAACELLLSLSGERSSEGQAHADLHDDDVAVGADLRYWALATLLGLDLLHRQRFVPTLEKAVGNYVARWRALYDTESDAKRLRDLARVMPGACRALSDRTPLSRLTPVSLLQGFIDALTDAVARRAMPAFGREAPRSSLTASEAWLAALRGEPVVVGRPGELDPFYREYAAWSNLEVQRGPGDSFRVCFRLEPPPAQPDDEAGAGGSDGRGWTLQYLLQATDDPSLLVSASEVWRQRGSIARFLDRRFDEPMERFLAGLGRASRVYPAIEASLRASAPLACELTTDDAFDFVREKALLLQASGFGVLVPGLQTKVSVRVRLGSRAPSSPGASPFNRDILVHFDWQVAIGDETISPEEFVALVALKQPLVQVRGQWVEFRPEQVEQALAFFERQRAAGDMPLNEALRLALGADGEGGLPVTEVTAQGWVADLIDRLRGGAPREDVAEPAGFVGQLRRYQKVGVSWLASLSRFGLGACLADDMGLGKTIELIAFLLHRKACQSEVGPTLLVCPTSVVGNWRRELERFAPGLRVLVHYGAGRSKGSAEAFAAEAAQHDIVVSTYALLYRDEAELASVEWANLFLDEAQNVKNVSTKAAQVARRLRAGWRVAITGTPVENRLSELWSIFDFLNPGYLGSAEAFRKRFVLPIEQARNSVATARLKKLVAPFILRRVKTDRAIIEDLPEKNEMKVFCTLTKEQATLYEAAVREEMEKIEGSEGIQRRGQVLATITKLKQVCDHPALMLHDQSALAGRSGKLARLSEMIEEVLATGDRALIFTQYAEMGRLLVEHLEEAFRREVLFLHGGTPGLERDRMVARFQSDARAPALFVLSLKAGGTGLNLTRANHVFHFDRWWNPAVENQATDRAFRISQRKDVQVHKFICAGTFEEALDRLIERKIELSQAIVGAGESWITELSTDELRDLFSLRESALAEEA